MLKVLIVEDEDIIRKGLAFSIDWLEIGYLLAGEAADGEEGLAKILELEPDVVIADIMMPRLDGIEMIRKAKKEHDFESIILTSYEEFDFAKQAIELHAYNYMLKPVDVDELAEVLTKLSQKIQQDKKKDFLYRKDQEGANIKLLSISDHYENYHVKKAVDIIREHYAEKLNLKTLADEVGMSPSYLSRKFKEETGINYLDFLNQYRIQQGIELLAKGDYKVYEVSEMTGFNDYKHFSEVFKKYIGVAPTDFIKNRHDN